MRVSPWDFKSILLILNWIIDQYKKKLENINLNTDSLHQILHLFSGFILDPLLQLNSLENSSKFVNVPITRNFPGL